MEDEKITGYEELENMLERFKAKNENEDCYKRYLYVPKENSKYDEELEFEDELDKAMKAIGIPTYSFQNCGGFDSCGYSIDCYCLAYIDKSDNLITIPVAFECY